MRFTKEKVLALVTAFAAALVLTGLQRPRIEAVPPVPPEEAARPWRAVAAAPRVAPEKSYRPGLRDPFQVVDPWVEAPPAPMPLPPGQAWPRALPVGSSEPPAGPADRLLVRTRPGQ